MARGSLAQEIAGRKIANGFYGWLAEEVRSSDTEINSYLANFKEARRRLTLGYHHQDNWTAAKDRSHLGRLPVWWDVYATNPSHDYLAARISFAALMFVSGAYRNQCYVQAHSEGEYHDRRSKAIGIPLQRTVTDHLITTLPRSGNFSHTKINLEQLDERRVEVATEVGEVATKYLCDRLAAGYDLEQEDSPSVQKMQEAQGEWIAFATDCVSFAAKIRRGELANVPFLEAKSISANPKVIYPLAS